MEHILLIDDDAGFNFLNSRVLKKLGVVRNLHICDNVPQALEFMKQMHQKSSVIPDLVLLDIRMPGVDGYGFLDALQELHDDIRQHCKVAMLTSSVDPTDRSRSFTYPQVIDFIEKPLDPGKFFAAVNRVRDLKISF